MNIQKIAQNIASSDFGKMAVKYTNSASEKIGGVLQTALEKSPKKDIFSKIINTIEPTGSNNAFIPMASLMVGTVIVPRVLTAAKRNPDDKEGTKDEIAEIVFRDVQTVLIMLFALKSINSIVAAIASKKSGLPMTNKPYQKIFQNNDKGFKGIEEKAKEFIQNPIEKLKTISKNVFDTLHPTEGVRALTNDEFVSKYSGYANANEISKMFEEIKNQKGNPDKTFDKVMNILIKNQKKAIKQQNAQKLAGVNINADKTQEILNALVELKQKGLQGLTDSNLNKDAENLLIDFFSNNENRLVLDAKGLNAALRTAALAFEAGYLGFGLPALNQKRLEKKYLSNQGKVNPSSPRAQATPSLINSKSIKTNRVKIFNKFIK